MAVDWGSFFDNLSKGLMYMGQQRDQNQVSRFVTQQGQQPGITREQYMANIGQLPGRLQSQALQAGRMFPSSTDMMNTAVASRRMDLRERQMNLAEKQFAAKGSGADPRKKMEIIHGIAKQLGDFESAEITRQVPSATDREGLRKFTLSELQRRYDLNGDNAKAVTMQLLENGIDPLQKDAYGRTNVETAIRMANDISTKQLINPNDPAMIFSSEMAKMQRASNEERRRHEMMIAGIKDQADVNESTQKLATLVSGAAKIQQLYDLNTGTVGSPDTIAALAPKLFDPNELYPDRLALEQYEKTGKEMVLALNGLTEKSKIAVARRFPETKKKFSPGEDLGAPARTALASVFPYIEYRLKQTSKGSVESYAGRRKELEGKGANEYVAHSAAGNALGGMQKSLNEEVKRVINDLFPGLDKDMRDLMVRYTFSALGSK